MIAEYAYNIWGERIKKTVYKNKEPDTTYYLYESHRLVAEANADGEIVKQYIYLNQPSENWSANAVKRKLHVYNQQQRLKQEDEGRNDITKRTLTNLQESTFSAKGDIDWYQKDNELIAMVGGQNVYWIHTDHLGTPKVMEDKEQNIVWQAKASAFGETEILINKQTLNIRFPGQYYDKETGLHYNYQRYYDPTKGRYITVDSLDLEGGMNRYVYAGNNPLLGIDALGELAFVPPAVVYLLVLACGAAGAAIYLQQQLGTDRALATVRLSSPFLTQASTDEMIATINAQYEPAPCTTEECQRARDRFKDGPTYPPDVCKGEPECEQLIDDLYDHLTEADVAAMTAGELSYCHQKASARGDKSHPCYGGTCDPNEYDDLDKKVKDAKKSTVGLGCNGITSSRVAKYRAKFWLELYELRSKLNERCFSGGNLGHKEAAARALQSFNNCIKQF